MMVSRFWMMMMIAVLGRTGVSFATFAIHGSGMVASAQVLVKNGSIGTMEGVLLSIIMAIVVDLKGCVIRYSNVARIMLRKQLTAHPASGSA